MLPDYDLESRRDPAMEQEALKIINQVIEVAEKDILVALGSGFDVGISLARAARGFLLQTVESVAERHQQHPLPLPDLLSRAQNISLLSFIINYIAQYGKSLFYGTLISISVPFVSL